MESILVENIKCGGCANGIKQALMQFEGVEQVSVDVENGEVVITLKDENASQSIMPLVKGKLLSMGYPEVGSVEGLKAATAKAKSFVSCAVGKMSDSATEDNKLN